MLSGCPLTFEMKVWVDSCRCLKPSLQKERPPGAELTERKETHRDTLHGPASGQELRGNLKGSWQDSIQGRGRRALLPAEEGASECQQQPWSLRTRAKPFKACNSRPTQLATQLEDGINTGVIVLRVYSNKIRE